MKITKVGVLPETVPAWPINIEFTCENCECMFIIEKGDKYDHNTCRHAESYNWIIIPCPECTTMQRYVRPTETRSYAKELAYLRGCPQVKSDLT